MVKTSPACCFCFSLTISQIKPAQGGKPLPCFLSRVIRGHWLLFGFWIATDHDPTWNNILLLGWGKVAGILFTPHGDVLAPRRWPLGWPTPLCVSESVPVPPARAVGGWNEKKPLFSGVLAPPPPGRGLMSSHLWASVLLSENQNVVSVVHQGIFHLCVPGTLGV